MLKQSWLQLPFLALALIPANQPLKPEVAQAHHNVVHSTAEAAVERVAQPTTEAAAAHSANSAETLTLIGLSAVVVLGFTAFFGTQLVGQQR